MLKSALIFVSGVTIGGFLGYKLAEKKFAEKFEYEVNSKIDEYVRTHEKKESKAVEPTRHDVKPKEKINYHNLVNEYEPDKEDDKKEESEDEEPVEFEHPEDDYEDSNRDPYLIEEEDFDDEDIGYEKQSLYYYRGNYTLVDDSDNIVDVDDANTLLGPDWPDYTASGVVYIRNEKVKTDYELVVNGGTYPVA